jgi:hypothetical protein
MPKLTKAQIAALTLLRARLNPNDAGFRASDDVRAAFDGPARLYIETRVLPLIDFLAEGPAWHGQAGTILWDAADVRHARATAENMKPKGRLFLEPETGATVWDPNA